MERGIVGRSATGRERDSGRAPRWQDYWRFCYAARQPYADERPKMTSSRRESISCSEFEIHCSVE